ncbi:RNA polymerase-associated protein CTR9-like, partial [Trifolium pratense]
SYSFKKGGQEVPIELLNNIGVLESEQREFELASCHACNWTDASVVFLFPAFCVFIN